MDFVNEAATAMNDGLAYLHSNMIPILICTIILYGIRTRLLKAGDSGQSLMTKASAATKSDQERYEQMMQVRKRQQEEGARRSAEAMELRREKETEEKKRKNTACKTEKKFGPGGSKSGKASDEGRGYNPMQPWTASGGGGYK